MQNWRESREGKPPWLHKGEPLNVQVHNKQNSKIESLQQQQKKKIYGFP